MTQLAQPQHAGTNEGDAARLPRRRPANVGDAERIASSAAGAALLGLALTQRGVVRLGAAACGAALLWHGAKRHSFAYGALGIGEADARSATPFDRQVSSRASVTIDAPAKDLYQRWRDIEGLARLFPHVDSIEKVGDKRFRWTAHAPAIGEVSWEASVTHEEEGRSLSWRSGDDAPFTHSGTIRFEEAAGGRGTRVLLEQRYRLPAGAVGALAARVMQADPGQEAAAALRRFKQTVEAGEISTSQSPSGRAARDDDEPEARKARADRPAVAHEQRPQDEVDRASMESFPASDAPARGASTGAGARSAD